MLPANQPLEVPAGPLGVASGAFGDGTPIPSDYTCDGANQQPPVS